MKKKLDSRFPATRIKKIMQADEDVGKIAMAVPLLVSKALELFLQDLCDRTYEITLERGVKTLNSLHLKQCVQSFNSFDFLKDIVSKVPDLGGSDGAVEDKSAAKKRKISEDEDGIDDESRRISMNEAGNVSSIKRGRGRPRGRGRGRGTGTLERETIVQSHKSEEAGDISDRNEENETEKPNHIARAADAGTTIGKDDDKSVRNFDLNVELNANGDSKSTLASAPFEVKSEDIPGWSLERIGIDPGLNGGTDEVDEDYDEE